MSALQTSLKKTFGISIVAMAVTLSFSGCSSMNHGNSYRQASTAHNEKLLADHMLRVKIEEALHGNENIHSQNINVNVDDGVVLLTGFVPTLEAQQAAGKSAKEVPGVKRVINQIKVKKAPSSWSQVKDTWITTKIRSKLLASGKIDPSPLTITTKDGVVYLLGHLPRKEALLAMEISRNTDGVKKVVSAIKYG